MLLYIGKILKFLLPSKSDDVNPVDIGKLKEAIHTYKVGSFLNTAYGKATSKEMWQEIIKVIQDEALNATTHIPVIFGLFATLHLFARHQWPIIAEFWA